MGYSHTSGNPRIAVPSPLPILPSPPLAQLLDLRTLLYPVQSRTVAVVYCQLGRQWIFQCNVHGHDIELHGRKTVTCFGFTSFSPAHTTNINGHNYTVRTGMCHTGLQPGQNTQTGHAVGRQWRVGYDRCPECG